MDQIIETLKTPAIAVALFSVCIALLSVIIQGIKSTIDIIAQIRNRKIVWAQRQIEYTSALLTIIEGLPIDEGGKLLLKISMLESHIPKDIPNDLKKVILNIIEQSK